MSLLSWRSVRYRTKTLSGGSHEKPKGSGIDGGLARCCGHDYDWHDSFAPSARAADAYPNRLIRLVVPFPAGSATDVEARFLVDKVSALLNQKFVIENKAGRERQYWRRRGRASCAGWLHALSRYQFDALGQRASLQYDAIRPGGRFHSHRAADAQSACDGGRQGFPGQEPDGIHRLCESQSGQAELWYWQYR